MPDLLMILAVTALYVGPAALFAIVVYMLTEIMG